mgnify:FL=1|jgi:homoserine dehydrogenase
MAETRRSEPHPTAATVRVGLLGCGTVGSALVQIIDERRDAIAATHGVVLEVVRAVVRSTSVLRPGLRADQLTNDFSHVVGAADIDVVVELMGGAEPAGTQIAAALDAGQSVVTGNKALMAERGIELVRKADAAHLDLLYEAAVAGGIPLIRALRESLAGERVRRVMGIVNGTTNFILTQMTESGAAYGEALSEAQALGFAEADPTADVEGYDAASKAAILATLAFGAYVPVGAVRRAGITGVSASDVEFATRLGYVVKLIATAEEIDGAALSVRVGPTLVPMSHPLAAVRGPFNAVFVEGDAAGELMWYGRGAGGRPSASAVLGDVIEAATNKVRHTWSSPARVTARPLADSGAARAEFYVSMDVVDQPGVLAEVAAAFGRHGVSLRIVEQIGLGVGARLVFITHETQQAAIDAAAGELAGLSSVGRVGERFVVITSQEA